MLPFTREAFLDIFAAYNDAIWPAQILAYCLGIAALLLVLRGGRGRGADSFIAGSLAAMWVWTGIFYHWGFFARVNDAAYGFGALFLLQGAGLAYAGVMRGRLRFRFRWNGAAWTGLGFVLYAMAIYPILGVLTGHRYPDAPVFGVTPCPVTIFTLGMVLIAARPVPPWLMIIPLLWSLIGGSAAFLLDMPQDWLLLFSGPVAGWFLWRQRRALPEAG
ncbi:MAG: DUF6064 family protein [Rhodomicrobiaceae bacterium]